MTAYFKRIEIDHLSLIRQKNYKLKVNLYSFVWNIQLIPFAVSWRGPKTKKNDETLYNKVQMFEPFQDRNPHFFGTVSLS